MNKFILIILVLRDCFKRFVGDHYPNEIVQLIVLASHESIKVYGGHFHTFLISKNPYKTYIWGCYSTNRSNIDFDLDYKNSPQELLVYDESHNSPIRFSKIKGSRNHIISLTEQSELYVWGSNFYGELGLGDDNDKKVPYKSLSGVKKINCNDSNTIIMTKPHSEIYVWGSNGHDYSPRKLQLPNMTSISCGVHHIIAFTKNSNKIYVWGSNCCSELGLGNTKYHNEPIELFLSSPILKISCGYHHTVALSINGNLFVWGSNKYGQLGLGDHINRNTPRELLLEKIQFPLEQTACSSRRIISVSCGFNHTMALTKSGEIYGWGDNQNGQVGIGNEVSISIPTKISLGKIISISCGGYHTIALTIYNDVFVWGYNEVGQLGLGDDIDRRVPCLLEFKF